MAAWSLRTASSSLADVGPQLLDGVELRRLARPLVGDLGEDLLLHLLDQDLEGDLADLLGVVGRRT